MKGPPFVFDNFGQWEWLYLPELNLPEITPFFACFAFRQSQVTPFVFVSVYRFDRTYFGMGLVCCALAMGCFSAKGRIESSLECGQGS